MGESMLEPCPICGGNAGVFKNDAWELFRAECMNTLCEFSTPWMQSKEGAEETWRRWSGCGGELFDIAAGLRKKWPEYADMIPKQLVEGCDEWMAERIEKAVDAALKISDI